MKQEKEERIKIDLELNEDIAQGTYANFAVINHSVSEFVLDFIAIMPSMPKARVKSRIILNPQSTKKLIQLLSNNVARFEKIHGPIKDYGQLAIPLNFGPSADA